MELIIIYKTLILIDGVFTVYYIIIDTKINIYLHINYKVTTCKKL